MYIVQMSYRSLNSHSFIRSRIYFRRVSSHNETLFQTDTSTLILSHAATASLASSYAVTQAIIDAGSHRKTTPFPLDGVNSICGEYILDWRAELFFLILCIVGGKIGRAFPFDHLLWFSSEF